MSGKTESGRHPSVKEAESHYEELFAIFASVAALFGYPPPPPPRKLRENAEWTEYSARRLREKQPIPDVSFYGYSPFVRELARQEAHNALRLLTKRIESCKEAGDKMGEAGLQYLAETIRIYLAKVEPVGLEPEGFLYRIPLVGGFLRWRSERGRKLEQAIRDAEQRRQTRGIGPRKKVKPEFLKPGNEKHLRIIYHTLRRYVLDENVSLEDGEFRKDGLTIFRTYRAQKETSSSTDEAIDFNKWLGLFFSELFRSVR